MPAKKSTAKKKAPTKRRAAKKDVTPVHVDSTTARSSADVHVGHFANVIGGEHKGKYGVFLSVATVDNDGYPDTVVFETRDADSARLVLNYKDLEPAVASGKRV